MVKRIGILILFMGVLVFVGCSTQLAPLIMRKIPYTENKLRIDGYYYSDIDKEISDMAHNIAIFYRDGFCFHILTQPKGQDILQYIEDDILLDDCLISKLKNLPRQIGVFRIKNSGIEFEIWDGASMIGGIIGTFSYYGEIINDTTFIINNIVYNGNNKRASKYLTYHFKEFSQKPDSTNVFVK